MARKVSAVDRGKKMGETPAKAPVLPTDADLPTSFNEPVGNGGETHQVATGDVATMTTQQGIPVADDQNSLKAGPRGPVLLEDFILREKIFTSITNVFLSASSMPAATARMACSN